MGRPQLPDDERMKPVTIRLPIEVVEFFAAKAKRPRTAMRKVLEQFVKKYHDRA